MEKVTKRKVFAASASAALVASAVVPAATFAAESNFTDISNLPASEQAAINALVDAGYINGKGAGKFDPYAQMKRAEAATVIAKVLGLDVNNAPDAGFSDVADNYWAKNYINAAVEAGILEGKGDGKFDPEAPMKRAELAQIVVKAFDLELVEGKDNNFTDVADSYWGKEAIDILYSNGLITGKSETRFAPEERMQRNHVALLLKRAVDSVDAPAYDINVKNVSAITATGVTVEIEELAEDLENANVVVRDASGKVVPTVARDLSAGSTNVTFNFVTPITVNPDNNWTVNGVRYVAGEFAIVDVESLTKTGKYIQVLFNQPIESLDASELTVRETVSLTRKGIQDVKLSADRMSAQITLLGDEDAGNILIPLRSYTLSITQKGEVTSFDFVIPNVKEEVTVTDVDSKDRVITLTDRDGKDAGDITVPEDYAFDFQDALGRQMTIWVDRDDKVVKHVVAEQTVKYDAIEVKYDGDTKKVKLQTEDKEYNLASGAEISLNGADFTAIDGDLNKVKVDYAKLVFDNNNRVSHIVAYQWNDYILVEGTDKDVVYGYGDEANFKDYIVVKEGKTIALSDLKEGDLVYFNTAEKYAEVYNKTVTGEIEKVFTTDVQISGKIYKYYNENLEARASYIDEDGKAKVLPTNTDDIKDIFDTMKDGGDVTVHVDRYGNLVFVTGDLEDLVYSSSAAYISGEPKFFTDRRDDIWSILVVDGEGKEKAYDVKVDDLEDVFGETIATDLEDGTYEGDQLDFGKVVNIKLDKDGKLKKVELLDDTAEIDSDNEIKVGDRYFKGNLIQNNATVFLAEKVDEDDFDLDDLNVTTYSELSFDKITEGIAYLNDKGQIVSIVVTASDRSADIEHVRAVVTSAPIQVADEDTWRIKLYIPGYGEATYYTEEDEDVLGSFTGDSAIKKGDFLYVNFNTDKDGNITDISSVNQDKEEEAALEPTVKHVTVNDISTRERVINDEIRLADDVLILDKDYKETTLSAIKKGDHVKFFMVSESGDYAAIAVITSEAPEVTPADPEAPTASASFADDTLTITFSANVTASAFDLDTEDGLPAGTTATSTGLAEAGKNLLITTSEPAEDFSFEITVKTPAVTGDNPVKEGTFVYTVSYDADGDPKWSVAKKNVTP